MKSILQYTVIVCLAAGLAACSVGVKKDLATGFTINYTGFSVENTSLSVDGITLTGNQVNYGSKVSLILQGVSGFSQKEGKVYPGCSIQVLDMNGNAVMEEEDIYAGYDSTGVAPEDAKLLTIYLTVGDPMKAGESYTWKSRIWDKNNEGEINTEFLLEVIGETAEDLASTEDAEQTLNSALEMSYEGLSVQKTSLSVGGISLSGNQVSYGSKINMDLHGVDGFVELDGMVKPGCSMQVINTEGNAVIAYEDLYAEYDNTGVSAEATETLYVNLTVGDPMQPGESYTWKVRFWDKNGQGEINAVMELQVTE